MKYQKIIKYLSTGPAVLLAVVGFIATILTLSRGIDSNSWSTMKKMGELNTLEEAVSFGSAVGFLMQMVIVSCVVAILAILAFVVINGIKNPKSVLVPAVATVIGGIIYAICYAMSSGRETFRMTGRSAETAEMLARVPDWAFNFADASLIFLVVLGAACILAIVAGEIRRIFL